MLLIIACQLVQDLAPSPVSVSGLIGWDFKQFFASAQPHNQFIHSEEFSGLVRFYVLTGIAVTGEIQFFGSSGMITFS